MNRIKPLFILILIIAVNPVFAESSKNVVQQPFSSTTIILKGAGNISDNTFNNYWDPGFGGGLRVELPFYIGKVLFGYQRMSFTGDNIFQPDFDSALSFFGVGQDFYLHKKLSVFAGGGFGNLKMKGDPSVLQGPAGEEDIFEETEFAYNLMGEFRYYLTDKILINAGIDHTIVHTRKKILITNFNVGIGYTFKSPNWLVGVLQ